MKMTKKNILANVLIRPVNTLRNRDFLRDKPCIEYFDGEIAGSFYVPIEGVNGFFNVTNDMGIPAEELEAAAKANAKYVINNMGDLIGDAGCDAPFKIITTESSIFGGAIILDNDAIAQFSNMTNGAYILPSSVHEVLILRDDGNYDVEKLRSMVRDINATQVAPEEVLSDNVFYFDGKEVLKK